MQSTLSIRHSAFALQVFRKCSLPFPSALKTDYATWAQSTFSMYALHLCVATYSLFMHAFISLTISGSSIFSNELLWKCEFAKCICSSLHRPARLLLIQCWMLLFGFKIWIIFLFFLEQNQVIRMCYIIHRIYHGMKSFLGLRKFQFLNMRFVLIIRIYPKNAHSFLYSENVKFILQWHSRKIWMNI